MIEHLQCGITLGAKGTETDGMLFHVFDILSRAFLNNHIQATATIRTYGRDKLRWFHIVLPIRSLIGRLFAAGVQVGLPPFAFIDPATFSISDSKSLSAQLPS